MTKTSGTYLGLTVASAVLSQLAYELGRGSIPIPDAWQWTVPLISAALVAITAWLPPVLGKSRRGE